MQDRSKLDDELLVEEAKTAPEGDLRAVEALVVRHQSRILANCRYLTGAPADAEDLAQEVFVKAFFSLDRFEGRAKFKTWLQKIKVNHCLNFLKKNAGRRFVDVDAPEAAVAEEMQAQPTAEQTITWKDSRKRISSVLESMPETLRVPLILRDADGFSYQEIADRLKVGLSAVKMRIKRGRTDFRRRFAETSPGPRPAGPA